MGHKQSVNVDEIRGTITVNKLETPHEPPKTFTFDTVFGPDSKQLDVYNLTARPIVDSVLEGYNGNMNALKRWHYILCIKVFSPWNMIMIVCLLSVPVMV